jgi:hypothetical protein
MQPMTVCGVAGCDCKTATKSDLRQHRKRIYGVKGEAVVSKIRAEFAANVARGPRVGSTVLVNWGGKVLPGVAVGIDARDRPDCWARYPGKSTCTLLGFRVSWAKIGENSETFIPYWGGLCWVVGGEGGGAKAGGVK